jgi:predicted RNase H-like HicB family nuclease
MTYKVEKHVENKRTYYLVTSPDMPDLSAQGNTEEEALIFAVDVKRQLLRHYKEKHLSDRFFEALSDGCYNKDKSEEIINPIKDI